VGEDYEGEIREEEAGYAGDAEISAAMETGTLSLQAYGIMGEISLYLLQMGHGRGWKKWPK